MTYKWRLVIVEKPLNYFKLTLDKIWNFENWKPSTKLTNSLNEILIKVFWVLFEPIRKWSSRVKEEFIWKIET